MLGLRARDPEFRMKFFSLYHESLGKTLFARLQYIIHLQDWEALSDVFWLKQGLDLLLAILVEDKAITLAPNSAKVPPLLVSGSPDPSGMQHQVTDIPEGSEDAPLTFDTLVRKHAHFLNEMSKLKVRLVHYLYIWRNYSVTAAPCHMLTLCYESQCTCYNLDGLVIPRQYAMWCQSHMQECMVSSISPLPLLHSQSLLLINSALKVVGGKPYLQTSLSY